MSDVIVSTTEIVAPSTSDAPDTSADINAEDSNTTANETSESTCGTLEEVATISVAPSSMASPTSGPLPRAPPPLPFQQSVSASSASTGVTTPRPNLDAILRMTREATMISAAPLRETSSTSGARGATASSAAAAATGDDSNSFKASLTQGINGHWLLFFGLTTAIVGVLVTLLGFTLLSYSEVTFGLLMLLVACVMMTVGIVRLNRRPRTTSASRQTASGDAAPGSTMRILSGVHGGAPFSTMPGSTTTHTMTPDYGNGRFDRQPPWAWPTVGGVESGMPAVGEAPPAYQPAVILLQPPSYEEATATTSAVISNDGECKDPDTSAESPEHGRHQPPKPQQQAPRQQQQTPSQLRQRPSRGGEIVNDERQVMPNDDDDDERRGENAGNVGQNVNAAYAVDVDENDARRDGAKAVQETSGGEGPKRTKDRLGDGAEV